MQYHCCVVDWQCRVRALTVLVSDPNIGIGICPDVYDWMQAYRFESMGTQFFCEMPEHALAIYA